MSRITLGMGNHDNGAAFVMKGCFTGSLGHWLGVPSDGETPGTYGCVLLCTIGVQ